MTGRPSHPGRHAAPPAGRAARPTAVSGALVVARAHARTGWPALLAWPLAMAALVVAVAAGIDALYPGAADREAYAAAMAVSPAAAAFNGRWHDLTTAGGITTNEVGFLGLLLFPPVGIHLAIARTRAEEDSGRAELLTAGRLGRLAPLAGAAAVTVLALALFAAASWAGLTALGLPASGAGLYAAGLALFVAWFAAFGLVAAQLARTARTAYAVALGGALAMFAARAVVDGRDADLPWLTPTGWLPEVRPFGPDPSALPLLLLAGTGLALLGVAAVVASRRDLGAGVLAPRPGPAAGGRVLGMPAGVAWRLTRGAFLGWTLGLAAWSAAIGTLTEEMTEVVRANPEIAALLGVDRPDDLVTTLALVVTALGIIALGLQGLGTLGAEEASGRLGLTLAHPVGRGRLWASWWAVLVAEAAVATAVGGGVLGLVTRAMTGRESALGSVLEASFVLLAAALAIIGVAALCGAVARGGHVVGWLVLGWVAVVALLAETLRLPDWARDLSPLELVGRVPVAPADGAAVAGCLAAALAGFVAATAVARRRDLRAG